MTQFKVADRLTLRQGELQRYLNEVSSIMMVTPDEEYKIAVKASKGDLDAIDELVKINLRFVISVAKMYSNSRSNSLGDLINEGNHGLIEAAHTFNPSTGFKFISYAVWHIRKRIMLYLTNHSRSIRLPQNQVNFLNKSKEIESDLAHQLDRDPTREEIIEAYAKYFKDARGTDLSYGSLKIAMESDQIPASLDPIVDSSSEHVGAITYINGDDLGSDYIVSNELSSQTLMRFISKLNERDRDILIRRSGINGMEPHSYSEIASDYECTGETIRLRYKSIIKMLRQMFIRSGIKLSDLINE